MLTLITLGHVKFASAITKSFFQHHVSTCFYAINCHMYIRITVKPYFWWKL